MGVSKWSAENYCSFFHLRALLSAYYPTLADTHYRTPHANSNTRGATWHMGWISFVCKCPLLNLVSPGYRRLCPSPLDRLRCCPICLGNGGSNIERLPLCGSSDCFERILSYK